VFRFFLNQTTIKREDTKLTSYHAAHQRGGEISHITRVLLGSVIYLYFYGG